MVVGDNRLALPLDSVERLIQTRTADIEHSGHAEVVQHEGRILPLIRLGHLLDLDAGGGEPDELTLVVCATREGSIGLVVETILDIEWADPDSAEAIDEPFLIGRLVVAAKVTELVDLEAVVEQGLHRHESTHGGEHA